MSIADRAQDTTSDAKEQIAQLRKQVETLMSERVTPVLADAAGRAESAVRSATHFTQDQAEMVSGHVRNQPLISLMVAGGVGYLIGRLFR